MLCRCVVKPTGTAGVRYSWVPPLSMDTCDLRELLHEGALFVATDCEFDDAALTDGCKRKTDDTGARDGAHACRCDGDTEANGNELQDGEPMRSLLDDARAKAICSAE